MQNVERYAKIKTSNEGKTLEAVSTSEKEVVFMGYDYILLLAFLVDVGVIQSFRVTNDKIIVHIKK